jgi:hypothetical protein
MEKYLPCIAELHRMGMMHVLPAEMQSAPKPPLPPPFVWVSYAGYTFSVALTRNDVDSLKKAVKTEAALALAARDAFTLTVKDDKGNVLKASAPLQANTEETAYIVE